MNEKNTSLQLDRIERGIRYLIRRTMYVDAHDGLDGLALDDALAEEDQLNEETIRKILIGTLKG